MKLSTVVELAAFACLVRMGFLFGPEAGWGAAGGSLLFVGYATDDTNAVVAVARVIDPARMWVRRRRESRRARRGAAKTSRDANRPTTARG